ncbi:MAG: energy transducer TonB [Verrucomicrobia bacterium]|nr:energy transducer TonB [Verrucomicrobiota bacterium]
MKILKYLLGAALFGSLLSVSAYALNRDNVAAPVLTTPVVKEVVHPTGLMDRHEGITVNVSMTIDAQGKPHDIRLLSLRDPYLVKQLVPTLAQWRFAPATRDGVPVSMKVILPVKLIAES